MKKITLLGDSIRWIGYGTKVPELLGNEYEVFQPDDNCRFSKYTLRGVMVEWAEGIEGSDIIHWNNGLWDASDDGYGIFSTVEEYVMNMVRIAKILKEKAKTVIFATITPVRHDNPNHTNDRIREYNAAVVPVLEEMGIIINDLNAFVAPHIEEYIREDDKIHLTEEGILACAEEVVGVIHKYEGEN